MVNCLPVMSGNMHTRQSQLAGAMHPTNIMGKGQIIPWHNLTSGLAESTTFFPFVQKIQLQQRFWLTTLL
jgi:hypothetical protein